MLDSYKLQLAQMPPSGLPMSKLVKTYAEFLHKFFQTFCVCESKKGTWCCRYISGDNIIISGYVVNEASCFFGPANGRYITHSSWYAYISTIKQNWSRPVLIDSIFLRGGGWRDWMLTCVTTQFLYFLLTFWYFDTS